MKTQPERTQSMNTKHTPGPWIVDDRHIHTAHGLTYPSGTEPETDVVAMIDTDCHASGLLNDTDKANLNLISAAPELLAFAESVVTQANGDLSDADFRAYIFGLAEQAIAKAKGNQ